MKSQKTDISENVIDVISDTGNELYKSGKKSFDENTGEAKEALRDVRDSFSDALNTFIEDRPYTTLAIALGIGFAIGALWKR